MTILSILILSAIIAWVTRRIDPDRDQRDATDDNQN